MFGADELKLGYLVPVLEASPSNVKISLYEGSVGPISGKGGVPPGWGLVGQEFEGGGVSVLAAQHGPLGQLQRWVEGWVLPSPFF